jgi:hypothetical protein
MRYLPDLLKLINARSVQRRKRMKKKKPTINIEKADAIGSIGVVAGMLSFFCGAITGMAMYEVMNTANGSVLTFVIFILGLSISITGSGLLVKASAKEMLKSKEEDKKEGESAVADCGADDACPSIDSGSACPSFGTDHCPLEHQRGDV